MFEKGNKLSKGRPANALRSKEILLPGIFAKNNINWGADFCRLYRSIKNHKASPDEKMMFKLLYDLLPFLVTKINIKELDLDKLMNKEANKAAQDQTAELVKLLENERPTKTGGNQSGMADGQPKI